MVKLAGNRSMKVGGYHRSLCWNHEVLSDCLRRRYLVFRKASIYTKIGIC